MDFQCLAGPPRNTSVDLKYDVLVNVCVRHTRLSWEKGLNFVLVGGTACCNPT